MIENDLPGIGPGSFGSSEQNNPCRERRENEIFSGFFQGTGGGWRGEAWGLCLRFGVFGQFWTLEGADAFFQKLYRAFSPSPCLG